VGCLPSGVTLYHKSRHNIYVHSQSDYIYTAKSEKRERFQVLTDMTMKIQVLYDFEPCQKDRFTLLIKAL
jgi:hypothetical protein